MQRAQADRQVRNSEHDLRLVVYQAGQHEPGLRALVKLAELQRDTALASWRRAVTFEEQIRWQTQYNAAQTIIDLVLKEPVAFNQTGRVER